MTSAVTETGTAVGTAACMSTEGAVTHELLDGHRRELTGYCYRMLGSPFDAEDAVQETLVRAWRAAERFEGRSSLRSWLYRIATNVCLDQLQGRSRRALPMDMSASPSAPVLASLGTAAEAGSWVEPVPDGWVLPAGADPADVAVERESVRLAFVTALQQLPPRQRAVLILRDVLRWRADEVAELLDSTVVSANSALQRARATLAANNRLVEEQRCDPLDEEHRALLDRYVDAFERYDMEMLVALLREDATQSMPPYALWLRGPDDIAAWHVGPGAGCRGSRLVRVLANGVPAVAQYKPSPAGGYEPWAVHVLGMSDGRITAITNFLAADPRLFELFGLSPRLED